MDVSMKTEETTKLNPFWLASSIYDFYHFCCPECDVKTQDKQEFVNHASSYHKGVSCNNIHMVTNYLISLIFDRTPYAWFLFKLFVNCRCLSLL